MVIYSLDTCIFIKAFFDDNKKIKVKYTKIIDDECRIFTTVLVKSVKSEFLKKFNESQRITQKLLEEIKKGRKAEEAIKTLQESSLIDKDRLLNTMKLFGLKIPKTPNEAEEFSLNIVKESDKINRNFGYYCSIFKNDEKTNNTAVKNKLQILEPEFKKTNGKFNEDIIHWPDNEHWVRSALFSKNESLKFITRDYFKLGKKNRSSISKAANLITSVINKHLGSSFAFDFR